MPVPVQGQRFRLISGDIAAISPGRLEVRVTSTGLLRTYALATVRSVRRNGDSVSIETPAAGVVTLTALTPDDAAALESALRVGILAAPDADDDVPAPAAFTPPAPSAPAPTPVPAPTPAPPADVQIAPATPAPPAANEPVILASGYRVEVTAQHVVVRQPGGQVINELPLQQVQAVGRDARTVTLRTARGEVNLIASSDVDAARLTGMIDTGRVRLAATPTSGPLSVTLQSGYIVTATATGIVVRDHEGSVVSSIPLSDLSDVTQSGQAVLLHTRAGQTNLVTASAADAERLTQAIHAHRVATPGAATGASASTGQAGQWTAPAPTPAPATPRPSTGSGSGQIPTWVIVVGVIMFLMFISNLAN